MRPYSRLHPALFLPFRSQKFWRRAIMLTQTWFEFWNRLRNIKKLSAFRMLMFKLLLLRFLDAWVGSRTSLLEHAWSFLRSSSSRSGLIFVFLSPNLRILSFHSWSRTHLFDFLFIPWDKIFPWTLHLVSFLRFLFRLGHRCHVCSCMMSRRHIELLCSTYCAHFMQIES